MKRNLGTVLLVSVLLLIASVAFAAYQLSSLQYISTTAKAYSWTNTTAAYKIQSVYIHYNAGTTNTVTLSVAKGTNNYLLVSATDTNMTDVVIEPHTGYFVDTNWVVTVSNSVQTNFSVIINRESAQ